MPIRILYIDHYPDMAGGQHSLVTILRNLDRAKVEPYVVCDNTHGSFTAKLESLDIPIFKVGFNKYDIRANRLKEGKIYKKPLYLLGNIPNFVEAVREIIGIVKDNHIDIIYANTVKSAVVCSFVSRLGRVPLIYKAHNSRYYSNHGWVDNIICHSASRIFANSEFTAKSLDTWSRKMEIIYPPVDFLEMESNLEQLGNIREEYGIDSNTFIITQIGRLAPVKRHRDLILSLSNVVRDYSRKAMLLCVGSDCEGPEQELKKELVEIIEELGLSEKVIFTGYRKDVASILKCTDLLVVPSEFETFGLVLVEALYFGVPVVASRCGAIPEIVRHNETGYLFEPKDVDDLTNCIMEVLRNYDASKELSLNGQIYVGEKFAVENILQKEYRIYLEIAIQKNYTSRLLAEREVIHG